MVTASGNKQVEQGKEVQKSLQDDLKFSNKEVQDQMASDDQKQRSWCSLPYDLLSIIRSHLPPWDHVVFGAVCKHWRSIHGIPMRQLLLVQLSKRDNTFKFLNPADNQIIWSTKVVGTKLSDCFIHCCNHAWLLVSKTDKSLFFLNPLTNEKILVPPTEDDFTRFYPMSFSSPPTSPDCLVIGITRSLRTSEAGNDVELKASVGVLRRGEDRWTLHDFTDYKREDGSRDVCFCAPIFYKGKYYTIDLDYDGETRAFDFRDNAFAQTVWPNTVPEDITDMDRNRCYLATDGDELIAVVVQFHDDPAEVHLLRWNETANVWEIMQNLQNKMLFVCEGISTLENNLGIMGNNNICFPLFKGQDNIFYSLTTRKWHSLHNTRPSATNILQVARYTHRFWIKPSSIMLKDDDRKW